MEVIMEVIGGQAMNRGVEKIRPHCFFLGGGSQWASRAPEDLNEMVSGCMGANPGAPAAQSISQGTQHPVGHHWAPWGPVEPPVRVGDQAHGEPTLGPCSALPMFVHAQGTLHPVGQHWGPDAFCGATSARRGSGTQRANPGPCSTAPLFRSVPRGSSTQLATTGP